MKSSCMGGEEIGYPYVATGHYARVTWEEKTGRWLLKKGLDPWKDQSYMLYSLTQWELSQAAAAFRRAD